MTAPTSLASKLAEVTAATGWVEKRGTAPANIGGYSYAMAVDIYATIRKELSSRGIASTVGITSYQHDAKGDGGNILTTITGDLTFIDGETGQIISVPFVGTGMDKGDKSTYKAITGGLRDALKANFLLPTGGDPEAESPEADKGSAKPRETAPRTTSAPVPPKAEKATSGLSDPQRNKLMARLNDVGLGSPGQRKAFLVQLLQKQSTKQMTPADLDRALAELDDEGSQVVGNARSVV